MNSVRASSASGHRPRRRTPLLRRAARLLLLALLLLFVVLLWSSETWQGEHWEFSNDKKDDGGAGAGAGAGTQRAPLDGKKSAPPMLNNKASDEAGNTHTAGPPTHTTTSSPPPRNTTTTIAVPEDTLVSAPPPLRLEQTPPSLDALVNETTSTTRTCSSNSSRSSSSSGHHWRNSSSKESSVLLVSVSDAPHTNTTTTTNLTTAINATAVLREGDEPPSGTPQPSLPSFPSPPPTLPVRPALWADGGGSVRLHGVFSVLTLAAGPPVTLATSSTPSAPPHPSPPPNTAAAARAEWLLRRAARGLHASGLTRHSRFHEWLIMHGGGTAVDGGGGAWQLGEEEAAVRAWWTEQEQREQRQSFSAAAQHTPAAALPRVRVAGLPPLPRSTAHLDKKAFALLYGVRLVVTEYVLLHDLSMVLIASTPHSSPFPAHSSEGRELHRDEWVRREVDVALQTISRNALADSPVVVVDAAPAVAAQEEEAEGGGRSMREEDVHCFRLQVYASADRRNATRETELQAQLVSFVKRALDSQSSPANTRQQTTVNAHASAVAAAVTDEGLPAEVYSTSPHFHCQRAPLYGVRMPVPAWMRAAAPRASLSPPNTAVAVSATPSGEDNKTANATTTHEKKARPLAPVLSTLCEVLLSRRAGMPDDYAPPTGAFFSPFCQEWWQLILLPLPSAGPKTLTAEEANTHVNTSNPLAVFGFGAAARQRHTKPQGGGQVGGGEAAEKDNGDEDEDDVKAQKQDMLQGMGDGLCTVEWLATLKAAQLFHAEEAERQRSEYARRQHLQQHQQQQRGSSSGRTTPESRAARGNATLSNIAGPSPYLRQYARLLFEQGVSGDMDDGGAAQRSRLAGTYLAYFPNATHALQRIHTVVSEKLRHVSLKYAAERTRRHKSRKAVTDREVVCVPSTLARVDRHAGLYATQWLLTNVALRCVLHKENCFGGLFESDVRVWQNVDRYLSTTGKWGRGEFRVCMSAGIFVADPSSVLT